MSKALTYSSYLALKEILNAQRPKSSGPEHDEMLFIIIHQVYELWFKQILHEIDFLKTLLYANEQLRALHIFRRLLTILKTVVSQIDILETMTPLEFNSFRTFLESASGFQSYQFRELEFVLGYKRAGVLKQYPKHSIGFAKIQKRFDESTLWDAFLSFLKANQYNIPRSHLERDVTQRIEESAEIQAILVDIYQNNPFISRICERLIDFDEGIQEWRYRHVKMVQRTIGNKPGTGGSGGVSYLNTTLNPLFPDLWQIRTQL